MIWPPSTLLTPSQPHSYSVPIYYNIPQIMHSYAFTDKIIQISIPWTTSRLKYTSSLFILKNRPKYYN